MFAVISKKGKGGRLNSHGKLFADMVAATLVVQEALLPRELPDVTPGKCRCCGAGRDARGGVSYLCRKMREIPYFLQK